MLRAGDLRHRIDIQELQVTKGSSGGVQTAWTPLLIDVPAQVINQSGTEKQATSHGGTAAVATTLFRIRYEPGISELMRIIYDGKHYNIQHINNVGERDVVLAITASTGQNDG